MITGRKISENHYFSSRENFLQSRLTCVNKFIFHTHHPLKSLWHFYLEQYYYCYHKVTTFKQILHFLHLDLPQILYPFSQPPFYLSFLFGNHVSSQTKLLADPRTQSCLCVLISHWSHQEWFPCQSGWLGNVFVIPIISMTSRVDSADLIGR